MFRDSSKETPAIAAPIKNTVAGEASQITPNTTGITTAAMWLIVKEPPAVEAISAGSAIFWK